MQDSTTEVVTAIKDEKNGLFIWTSEHLKLATQAVQGQWSHDNHSNRAPSEILLSATRIITDTRKIEAGDIFLAIVGDKFDGNDFVQAAADKGAVAAIVSRYNADIDIPQLIVTDTRIAFGDIAAYRRQQHPNVQVIAITGSSGKTTVKEMLRSIFIQLDASDAASLSSTLVTRGNLNNDYGVPMMMLELAGHHRYAVLELGANHVGEIAYTADIVRPDVACILNIGTAHLGEFGGRDNIARTKAEIYQPLTNNSTAVVPFDDDYVETLRAVAQQHTTSIINCGWQFDEAEKLAKPSQDNDMPDVYASDVTSTATQNSFILHFSVSTSDGQPYISVPVELPMAGQHNVSNALAAASCAYAIGVAPDVIATGLSVVQSTKGRLERQTLGKHTIIDDTYNANPNSVRAAADVLAAQEGETILVLGDIGELGEAAADEHHKLGQAIAAKNIDRLLCVGAFAKYTVAGANAVGMTHAAAFSIKPELLTELQEVILTADSHNKACTLLFKGSRTATIETLIEGLIQSFESQQAQ